MTPAELRRAYRAARTIERAPALAAALEARCTRADAILRAALAGRGSVTVPGYRVIMADDKAPAGLPTVRVEPMAPTHVDQLALWKEARA